MSDPLAERLRKLALQKVQGEQADKDEHARLERAFALISDNARAEFDRLIVVVAKRAEELNPQIGDLPKYNVSPSQHMVEQGNAAAYLVFDKPILNRPENALLLSFGPHRNAMFIFDRQPPAPVRYRLEAAATDAIDGIVWVGDLGELDTQRLADMVLEILTTYYLEHKSS